MTQYLQLLEYLISETNIVLHSLILITFIKILRKYLYNKYLYNLYKIFL